MAKSLSAKKAAFKKEWARISMELNLEVHGLIQELVETSMKVNVLAKKQRKLKEKIRKLINERLTKSNE